MGHCYIVRVRKYPSLVSICLWSCGGAVLVERGVVGSGRRRCFYTFLSLDGVGEADEGQARYVQGSSTQSSKEGREKPPSSGRFSLMW